MANFGKNKNTGAKILFFVLTYFIPLTMFSGSSVEFEMRCQIKVLLSKKKIAFKYEIKNTSSKNIKIYISDFPKPSCPGFSMSLLKFKKLNQFSMIERIFPIEDPLAGSVEIDSGKLLRGEFDLCNYFPSILDQLRKNDLFLLWSFQLEDIHGKKYGRKTGVLVIDKLN